MKILYIILGLTFLGIGSLGAILPFLPSTVFLILAAFFFGKSSKRLNDWFVSTKLYKNHLESFIDGRAMYKKSKVLTIVYLTVLFGFCFFLAREVLVAKIAIATVWMGHVLYFSFRVRTINKNNDIVRRDENEII